MYRAPEPSEGNVKEFQDNDELVCDLGTEIDSYYEEEPNDINDSLVNVIFDQLACISALLKQGGLEGLKIAIELLRDTGLVCLLLVLSNAFPEENHDVKSSAAIALSIIVSLGEIISYAKRISSERIKKYLVLIENACLQAGLSCLMYAQIFGSAYGEAEGEESQFPNSAYICLLIAFYCIGFTSSIIYQKFTSFRLGATDTEPDNNSENRKISSIFQIAGNASAFLNYSASSHAFLNGADLFLSLVTNKRTQLNPLVFQTLFSLPISAVAGIVITASDNLSIYFKKRHFIKYIQNALITLDSSSFGLIISDYIRRIFFGAGSNEIIRNVLIIGGPPLATLTLLIISHQIIRKCNDRKFSISPSREIFLDAEEESLALLSENSLSPKVDEYRKLGSTISKCLSSFFCCKRAKEPQTVLPTASSSSLSASSRIQVN